MAKAFLLSENDKRFLQDLVDKERRRIGNPIGRGRVRPDEHQAPEVYVARTPPEGIPAIDCDRPGWAECDIYRIDGIDQFVNLELMVGLSKSVYNLAPFMVPGNQYVPVWRDKGGDWLAQGLQVPCCERCLPLSADEANPNFIILDVTNGFAWVASSSNPATVSQIDLRWFYRTCFIELEGGEGPVTGGVIVDY